jgi:DNA polymerase III delta prime subunit
MLPLIVAPNNLDLYLKSLADISTEIWWFGSGLENYPDHKDSVLHFWSTAGVDDQSEMFQTLCFQTLKLRIVFLTEIENMSAVVMAGWLKVLEDPPVNTQFVLLCGAANRLPATILSRSGYFQILNKNLPLGKIKDNLSLHERLNAVYTNKVESPQSLGSALSVSAWQPYNLSRLDAYAAGGLVLPLID